MNTTSQPFIFIALGVGLLLLLLVCIFIIYRRINSLNTSFAKLGYVNREDAKKYFGDAADKVSDMNSSFYQQYQKIIEDSVRKVLSESGQVMEGSLVKAQQDAGSIVLKAQQDAQQILASTKQDAKQYFERALSESVDAMEWALEQYLDEHLSLKQHETIIDKLLQAYVNERKLK